MSTSARRSFGGSCLPKDLRALVDMARLNALDVPLLTGTLHSNELVIRDAVDRLIASPYRTVAMLGLSFKMNTDDLRESPNVELAERLIGKGFDARIYDPIINPERLIGSNLRYAQDRLPHLTRLLASSPAEALDGAEAAVVSTSDPAVLAVLRTSAPGFVLDLNGRLGTEIEQLPGYDGIGWAA